MIHSCIESNSEVYFGEQKCWNKTISPFGSPSNFLTCCWQTNCGLTVSDLIEVYEMLPMDIEKPTYVGRKSGSNQISLVFGSKFDLDPLTTFEPFHYSILFLFRYFKCEWEKRESSTFWLPAKDSFSWSSFE